jgi:RimJ/RimL family protein N-acetyltransferase
MPDELLKLAATAAQRGVDCLKEPIIGERVILREQRSEDAEFFTRWYNEPEIMFECGFHQPTTLEKELNRILRSTDDGRDWYAITDLSGRIIGETGLLRMWPYWRCTDMSMIIPDPDDQGNGYGSEAGRLMLDRAFRHYNMNRVAIGVVGLNTQALRYWERLGFKKEGIEEKRYNCNGEFSDFVMMRILRSEYCNV